MKLKIGKGMKMRGYPFVLAFAACALQAAALEIKVEADHADCVYAVGETAKLTVTFTEKDGSAPTGGVVRAALDNFGETRVFETRELDLGATNRFEFAKALPYPGFLRLRLAHPERPRLPQDDPEWYMWSVAFSPERIVQGAENPADFDAYWKREKARLECEVPLDAKVAKDESQSNEQVDVFRVSFATFSGRRVYGWLSVPKDRSAAPFPVLVQVPGAGCGTWTNNPIRDPRRITLFMTVFDWEPDPADGNPEAMKRMWAFNAALREKEGFALESPVVYQLSGCRGGRDGYFYHDTWLGINRAVDWLAARDDVDLRSFVYEGTSQGGAAGLALGCLNSHFTKIAVYVPAMTDMLGDRWYARQAGWPYLVSGQLDAARKDAAELLAPYYEGANFARRIVCTIRFAVGFADRTCPPHAVYAAFNACGSSDKKITRGLGMTHDCFGWIYTENGKWAAETAR